MTDRIDLANHFRRIINKRYRFYLGMTGFAIAISLLLFFLSDKGSFLSFLASTTCAFGIGLLIRNGMHVFRMLDHLHQSQHAQFNQLEKYLEEKQLDWQKNLSLRLIIGSMTGLVMFFLLVFYKDALWTMTISSVFIVLVVVIAVLGWIDFNDQVLLHDIRRSHRDQASNMPE